MSLAPYSLRWEADGPPLERKERGPMTNGQPQQPQADEHVFLIGRPPMAEYLGYVKTQTVGGDAAAIGALADEWRAANDHIVDLENKEAGLADDPPVQEI